MRRPPLPFRVVGRFIDERYAQTAAALSFSTLLAMVPTLAIALVIFSRLPYWERVSRALENFLLAHLLPGRAGAIIARYVGDFAQDSGRLTLIGGLALAVTALAQMLTVEHAMNAIWRVRENRPMLRRIAMHATALLLGPVLFGASLALTTYIASASYGLVEIPFWAKADVLKTVTFLFLAGGLALFYHVVPNCTVSRWHAIWGGLIAASGFAVMQILFARYVAKMPGLALGYGAFSAIPIFLLWLYLSWGVILVGALVVAEIPWRPGTGRTR